MNESELIDYQALLGDIKDRVRGAQRKAVLSVNATMILMYWDIGRMIASRQAQQGWGAKVIPRLAVDLKNELPDEKGFSPANLKRMVRFWKEYPELSGIGARSARQLPATTNPLVANADSDQISAPVVRPIESPTDQPAEVTFVLQLSWSHNIVLMQKLTDKPIRFWYARQTAEQGWSRDRLTAEIKSNAHQRQGAAVTNFSSTLPEVHAQLATGLLKDPLHLRLLNPRRTFPRTRARNRATDAPRKVPVGARSRVCLRRSATRDDRQ